MRRMDFYTGLVTAAVGAAPCGMPGACRCSASTTSPGPGFFPKILAGLLVVLGLLLRGIALREHEPPSPTTETTPPGGAARTAAARRPRVLVAFAVIAPLVAVIGYIPAMVLLVLVVLYGIERRRDFRSLVVAVLIPIATYLLFAHVFAIPLPSGPLLPA